MRPGRPVPQRACDSRSAQDLSTDAPLQLLADVPDLAPAITRGRRAIAATAPVPRPRGRQGARVQLRGTPRDAMHEKSALEVTAVRAIETSDRARTLWSDADRTWASRAAAEVVGEGASVDDFVARRAKLALERIGSRQPALTRAVEALRWRQWVGAAIVLLSFLAGMAFNRIGSGQRINLLAPPVLALLAWNVVVYALLLVAPLLRAGKAREAAGGFLRRLVARIAGGAARLPRDRAGPAGEAVATFAADWTRFSAPLYAARTARILHFAAAAFAVGVVAGMYLRGLAVEYRATWESTFLDPATVHALLSFALWPGATLTGIPIPSVEAISAIRSGGAPASENAASWLHLLAATVAAIVIGPRLVLGLAAWAVERRRASRVKLPLNEPYFNRIVRGFKGGPVRLKVVPYSFQVPAESLSGLQTVVARTFGGSAAMMCASPVGYGDEDALPKSALPDGSGPAIALFNLAATPEREAHGAFVDAMRTAAAGHPVIVLVDEAAFRARNPGDDRRLEERRAAWRGLLGDRGVSPVFADLSAPDLPAIERQFDALLGARR